jgi:hypothetical protein
MGGRPPSPIGVIDLSTGKLALGIQQDMTPVGPQMVFDEASRLNFRWAVHL